MDLREHTLQLQRLEQSAVEKAGLRVRLIDESALVASKGGPKYARRLVETILGDVKDELVAAARLGVKLGEAIAAAKERAEE